MKFSNPKNYSYSYGKSYFELRDRLLSKIKEVEESYHGQYSRDEVYTILIDILGRKEKEQEK